MTAVPPIAAASVTSPIPAPFRQSRPKSDFADAEEETSKQSKADITTADTFSRVPDPMGKPDPAKSTRAHCGQVFEENSALGEPVFGAINSAPFLWSLAVFLRARKQRSRPPRQRAASPFIPALTQLATSSAITDSWPARLCVPL